MQKNKLIKEIFPWHPDKIFPGNIAYLKNFVAGEWTVAKKNKTIINPLNGLPIIAMPDTREDVELLEFTSRLGECPKYGLHNPLYNTERYRMYGDISARAARLLRDPDIRDYFAKLINLVMPKGYDQTVSEVDVTASFLETFSGNNVINSIPNHISSINMHKFFSF